MDKPKGQLASAVPISRQCLLKLEKQQYTQPIHLSNKHNLQRTRNRCENLPLNECIRTPKCGWLSDSAKKGGRCYEGTPIGPINPMDVPDAENSVRRNLQMDRWRYYQPHLM